MFSRLYGNTVTYQRAPFPQPQNSQITTDEENLSNLEIVLSTLLLIIGVVQPLLNELFTPALKTANT